MRKEELCKSVIVPDCFISFFPFFFLCYESLGRLIFLPPTSRLQSAGFVLRRCRLQPPLPSALPQPQRSFSLSGPAAAALPTLALYLTSYASPSAAFFRLTNCYSFTGLTSSSFRKEKTTKNQTKRPPPTTKPQQQHLCSFRVAPALWLLPKSSVRQAGDAATLRISSD